MTLTLRALPAFADNYIWLLHDGRHALVVDPGDAAPVLEALASFDLQLGAILATHHHGDHVGGIAELLRHHPGTPVFGPAAETIPGRSVSLSGGEHLQLQHPAIALAVLATPGHTRGHLGYYGAGYLFCGDTLFGCGCGRLFEGSPAQMLASLASLARLPDDTLVCCAHEYTLDNLAFALTVDPENAALSARLQATREVRRRGVPSLPSTLGLEKATNPFLRCDTAALRASAVRRGAPSQPQAVEVFAVIRNAKDTFKVGPSDSGPA